MIQTLCFPQSKLLTLLLKSIYSQTFTQHLQVSLNSFKVSCLGGVKGLPSSQLCLNWGKKTMVETIFPDQQIKSC